VAELESAKQYIARVRARLAPLDFAGKRLVLEALGVRVVVDRDDYRVEGLIPTGQPGDIAFQPSSTLERNTHTAAVAVSLPRPAARA
jgi:hypothetical protein